MSKLDPPYRLGAQLVFGGGLRVSECARLRVKDLDPERHELTGRRGAAPAHHTRICPATPTGRTRRLNTARSRTTGRVGIQTGPPPAEPARRAPRTTNGQLIVRSRGRHPYGPSPPCRRQPGGLSFPRRVETRPDAPCRRCRHPRVRPACRHRLTDGTTADTPVAIVTRGPHLSAATTPSAEPTTQHARPTTTTLAGSGAQARLDNDDGRPSRPMPSYFVVNNFDTRNSGSPASGSGPCFACETPPPTPCPTPAVFRMRNTTAPQALRPATRSAITTHGYYGTIEPSPSVQNRLRIRLANPSNSNA